jgi:hypothetical protein
MGRTGMGRTEISQLLRSLTINSAAFPGTGPNRVTSKRVLPNYLPHRRPQRTRSALSRRDSMKVARQFTAWKPLEKAFRPVRVRHDSGSTFCSRPQDGDRMPHRTKSYRLYETAISLASFQALNCQATLIKSLRDKVLRVLRGLLYGR